MAKYNYRDANVVFSTMVDEINRDELERVEFIASFNNLRKPYSVLTIRKTYKNGSWGEKYNAKTMYEFDCEAAGLDAAVGGAFGVLAGVEREINLKVKKDNVPWIQETYSLEVK